MAHGASFFFSGRALRRAERSFAARVSVEISDASSTRGEGHETPRSFSTNSSGPAQPPSDPSAFLRSLEALGGKHALFGRWLADRVANADRERDDEKNVFYVHPALVARRAPGAGVGVFAENTISPGHVLFRAPSFLFESLSAAHAETVARRRVPAFVERCERACAELGAPAFAPHALFALHVLFELGDERSPNFGYLASLPGLLEVEEEGDVSKTVDSASQSEDAHHLSVPLLWDARRVATLRGTPTFANVAARRAFVEALHASLFGAGGGASAPVPLAKFKWALSTILSRATSGARAPYALAPGVDLFNHGGADATCALHAEAVSPSYRHHGGTHTGPTSPTSPTSHADDGAYASLSVACHAGSPRDAQLTISYGDAADNDRLLRVYGFAVENNPNDRSELRMRIEGAALERWRAFERFGPGVLFARRAVLRRHGLPRLAPFEETENTADALFDDVAQAAERALGGGVAFRDPGDFRSALGEAKETTSSSIHGDASRDDALASFDDGDDDASRENEPEPILWKCFVAHPAAAPFPARTPAPMDSASPEAARACDAATAAARGVGGGAVSADALLASVRAHLLNGTEPPGPDGHEPDPWAPVSEMNEAATRAVVGEAAYAAMRAHVESLQPNANEAKGAEENDEKKRRETTPEPRGFDPFAAPSADPAAALSPAAAARARLDLAGGEAWARSALALRRGQVEILEHVLGKTSI